MNDWRSTILVLAEGEAPKEPAGQDGAAPGPGGLFSVMIPLIPILIVFYLLVIRPQQREKAKHDKLLSQLKKNDRVVTIGGIIGQVVSVSTDEKEIVLKVDDNTRIRFRRSAIQGVLSEPASAEDAAKTT